MCMEGMMGFIADNAARRTFDPVRGLELVTNGGGSDGSRNFRIVGQDVDFKFTGHVEFEAVLNVDPMLPAPEQKWLIWQIDLLGQMPDRSMEETETIVREALSAFKFVHGKPNNQLVKVVLPSDRRAKSRRP